MSYIPELHHRHSTRLKDYDYSLAGAYFITICTWQRACLFGDVVDGKMMLNDIGSIVLDEWERTKEVRKNVIMDEFVIMPNHIHGIIFNIDDVESSGRPTLVTTTAMQNDNNKDGSNRPNHRVAPVGPAKSSIGAIMAQFKSIVTKRRCSLQNNTGCSVWQRNYYERIIRSEDELLRAQEYIVNNPMKWELGKENPVITRYFTKADSINADF